MSSIYKPQGAGNIRTVPGAQQMCLLADVECDWKSLELFLFKPVSSVGFVVINCEDGRDLSVLGAYINSGVSSSGFAASVQI